MGLISMSSFAFAKRFALFLAPFIAAAAACGDDAGTSGGTGGSDTTSGTTSTTSTKASSTSSSSSSTTTTATTGSSSSNGTGGAGGAEWPDCLSQPAGSDEKSIPEIWTDDPAFPTAAWVPGVFITAISGDGCVAGQACQFFVQQEETYATLVQATHQSLRVAVAPDASEHFVGLAVGDQVDMFASAFRDTQDGKNELIFLVTSALPGCANAIGAGDPLPVTVTLDDLTVDAYEETIGPVLVRVETVSGNPNMPAETFALWDTGAMPGGDITTVTSLSPFFLAGSAFVGLTPDDITDFSEVVGVFGIFAPPADPLIKYEEIYARSGADYTPLP